MKTQSNCIEINARWLRCMTESLWKISDSDNDYYAMPNNNSFENWNFLFFAIEEYLTSEWINTYFFSFFQRFINVFLLDTLNAQIGECCGHVSIVDFKSAHSFAANILSHQFVWMGTGKSNRESNHHRELNTYNIQHTDMVCPL